MRGKQIINSITEGHLLDTSQKQCLPRQSAACSHGEPERGCGCTVTAPTRAAAASVLLQHRGDHPAHAAAQMCQQWRLPHSEWWGRAEGIHAFKTLVLYYFLKL